MDKREEVAKILLAGFNYNTPESIYDQADRICQLFTKQTPELREAVKGILNQVKYIMGEMPSILDETTDQILSLIDEQATQEKIDLALEAFDSGFEMGQLETKQAIRKEECERILKIASDFISPSAYNRICKALVDKGE